MKTLRIFILLFLFFEIIYAQESDFPRLNETSFDNIKIETSKYYNGNSLWGLINGGADLYLEYGFDKLLHQQVKINKKDYRIEIYKMIDPLSAFGIFSISKFKCDSTDSEKLVCITKYQTQGVKGSYYLSISNSSGDNEGKKICLEIFDIISEQIVTESDITIDQLFPKISLPMEMNNIKFIKGQLGIQNGYPMWVDIFEGVEKFTVSIFPFDKDSKEIVIGQINFEDENDAEKMMNKNDILLENQNIKKLGSKLILITDSEIPETKIYNLLNLN